MHSPPAHVTSDDVLTLVRSDWDASVDAVTHLPVGFGAHHWRASAAGQPRWFVTLDDLAGLRHTAASLEAAYAGAAALAASGLEFVLAGLASCRGTFTVPLRDGALSVTPWQEGIRAGDGPPPDRRSAEETAAMLARLHGAAPPPGLPRWQPLVGPTLADDLARRTSRPWTTGPHGEPARRALVARLDAVGHWVAAYHRLAEAARRRDWVATHGEPHTRNQLVTSGTVLVDWESLKLAPPERDLRMLVDSGHGDLVDADPAMVEMFDLEWRLDEVSQYADWFSAPHAGGPDDEVALGGLLHELDRPEWAVGS